MTLLKSLRNEFKLIYRDSILLMMMLFVIYLGVVLRFLVPWVNEFLVERSLMPGTLGNITFDYYYPLVLSFMVIFTGPQLSGAIFGFLILSDKDDQTIKALMVTPMSSMRYIHKRIVTSWFMGAIFIFSLIYMININVGMILGNLLIAAGGGLLAPIVMLFLGITSESKVQGMSYSKFLSIFGILLVISWFVNDSLQWLFGLLPYYWISKAYWAMNDGNIWMVYITIGIIYQLAVIYIMSKTFNKKLFRSF